MRDTSTPSPSHLGDHLSSRLLEQRIIVLDGELDDRDGTRLCSQLFLLSAEDSRADISLWINSPGGSVPAMLAIHDAMRLIPNDVSTLALGLACSAGQFLLTAGTHGKRYALRHSRILMHQGSAGIGGVTRQTPPRACVRTKAPDQASGPVRAWRCRQPGHSAHRGGSSHDNDPAPPQARCASRARCGDPLHGP